MGYDLTNEKSNYFRWNIWGWGEVINLALSYDWQPQGTEIDKNRFENYEEYESFKKDYEGSYFGNDGQRVCAEDAKAFSDALESSLDDIPDERVEERESTPIDDKFLKERAKIWNQEHSALMTRFSGKSNKKYLKDFITFLREGAFYIY
tara:strand:+ start:3410 stop:3856 length:447 start_codon:yes stop_codon:yes gene_type:complete